VPSDRLPGTFFGPPNLVELVRHRAAYQPDDVAFTYLVDGENEQVHLSNAELDRQAQAIGAWLESLGLAGERALLLYPPGLEFIAAFFGCLYAGVVAVPVYPPRRNRSLARIQAIADDADAKVALTTDVVLQRVEPLIDDTPHLKQLTWLATCHVPEGMHERWQMPDIDGDTVAFLQYTSGSTGTPKGVVLNHTNLIHNSALIAHAFEHTRSSLGVFWLPSYHDMGLIGGILQPLYVGRPNVLMSPMAFLQRPFRWLSAISRFGGTTSGGPNFAYELCVQKITAEQRAQLDLSSWEVAFNGAEPVREETLERFAEAFEPCGFRREAFFPCFGLAEATLIVSGGYAKRPPVIRRFDAQAIGEGTVRRAAPGDRGARAAVGCGETMPDQRIVIADPETLASCPDGRIGEIWVRGPSVAQGYWRRPDISRKAFGAHLSDTGEGPFLRTGDLGFLDDGELFVTGRIKDLIILHGVNVYPQDVELTVQRSHPRLRPDSGAVFAVEAEGREKLVVVQELERRAKGDLSDVFQAIRRAVSAEHETSVDAIVLIKAGSIPKTSSGKIQRHACRKGYLDGTLTVVEQWPQPVEATAATVAGANGVDKPSQPIPPAANARRNGGRGGDVATSIASWADKGGSLTSESSNRLGTEPGNGRSAPEAPIPPECYPFDKYPGCVKVRPRSASERPAFAAHEGVDCDPALAGVREIIRFTSPNYLGMSGDPTVLQAAQEAMSRYGTSPCADGAAGAQNALNVELEHTIARFLGTEDALVFAGGYAARQLALAHLSGAEDLILHEAAWEPIGGLSQARRERFGPNDWRALEQLLDRHRRRRGRAIVAVDGLNTSSATAADLPRLIELIRRHKARLIVDETHSLGTLGLHGRGVSEYFGVDPGEVDVWTGSLGAALGSCGGYVAGSRAVVDGLRRAVAGRGHEFGIAPPNAGAALAAFQLLEAEPERVVRLHERSQRFAALVRQRGLNARTCPHSPAVVVVLGDSVETSAVSRAMGARGIHVETVFYPTVEQGTARLRFLLTSMHRDEEIDDAVDVLADETATIGRRHDAGASRLTSSIGSGRAH